MNIINKIEHLRIYLLTSRGVGHSTLMKVGTNNYRKDKFVLCSEQRVGDSLGLRRSEILSLGSLETLRSHNKPLAIDNSALVQIFTDILLKVKELENENISLRNDLNNDRSTTIKPPEFYRNTPIWQH